MFRFSLTSKFLTDILAPLQNSNNYSVSNFSQLIFIDKLANITMDEDEILGFLCGLIIYAIPVEKACM